ncbi:hypothetical protein FRC01_014165 [Tulasnella sp. 417]|nr:hypothetical protein FRC01_014165 [Tulasnella sp. 417]
MQLQRQANSTSRAKSFVDKTKGLFGVITSSIKYPQPKAPSFAPLNSEEEASALTNSESDRDSALFYPTPLFARRFTSSSQHSGSTRSTTSTTTSSIFSRLTDQTATTVTGEGYESRLEGCDGTVAVKEDMGAGATQGPYIFTRFNEPARGPRFPALQANSIDDESYSGRVSEEEEDDDEGILFIHSKWVKQPVFATSLTRSPYASFLSQASYKPPYIFPTIRCSVDSDDA